MRSSRSDQPVQLEGPVCSIREYDILRREVVAVRHIESAAGVGQHTLLKSSTQCRGHVGLVVCFRTILEDIADFSLLREGSLRTY